MLVVSQGGKPKTHDRVGLERKGLRPPVAGRELRAGWKQVNFREPRDDGASLARLRGLK